MNKPSIPKGTRDFSPTEMAKRNYIFNTIRSVFALYGFEQIETPAMENLSTLMGKYGEEGDKLLYKILNSGDFRSDISADDFTNASTNKLAALFCEKGLRYDLTVPFARYVVQHREELQLPFKRYQIQPVWRADRPQKGRYREFYQCDADIVGSTSLLNEIELMEMVDEVMRRLGVRVELRLNNRKILNGIAEWLDAKEKLTNITIAIDKMEKVGVEQVNRELVENGLSAEQVARLQPLFTLEGTNEEKLAKMEELLSSSTVGLAGIEETRYILDGLKRCDLTNDVLLDTTLARGLNYYTGAIFEVKAKDVVIGSITGGGRYDNLTGIFGLEGLSGVGISFGADRIFDVLNQLDLYPKDALSATQLLFVTFGEESLQYCIPLARKARQAGISAEIYPDEAKLKKQMSYANAKSIPFVALAGEDEVRSNTITVKNMTTGAQKTMPIDNIDEWLKV